MKKKFNLKIFISNKTKCNANREKNYFQIQLLNIFSKLISNELTINKYHFKL